jgi:hypothetical protein
MHASLLIVLRAVQCILRHQKKEREQTHTNSSLKKFKTWPPAAITGIETASTSRMKNNKSKQDEKQIVGSGKSQGNICSSLAQKIAERDHLWSQNHGGKFVAAVMPCCHSSAHPQFSYTILTYLQPRHLRLPPHRNYPNTDTKLGCNWNNVTWRSDPASSHFWANAGVEVTWTTIPEWTNE